MMSKLDQKLKNHHIDSNLIQYMKQNIYPLYANVDLGHRIPHIEQVIDRSIDFMDYCNNTHLMRLDPNIVYTVAGYHDVGLSRVPREIHEKESARMFMDDAYMKDYFSKRDFTYAANAIEDHRASLEDEPRSIYGKIVSQADRCYDDFSDYIIRCYHFRENKSGFDTMEKIALDARQHLIDKFGSNGYSYSKVWFPDANLTKFKQDAFDMLNTSEEEFVQKFESKVKAKLAMEKLSKEVQKSDQSDDINVIDKDYEK